LKILFWKKSHRSPTFGYTLPIFRCRLWSAVQWHYPIVFLLFYSWSWFSKHSNLAFHIPIYFCSILHKSEALGNFGKKILLYFLVRIFNSTQPQQNLPTRNFVSRSRVSCALIKKLPQISFSVTSFNHVSNICNWIYNCFQYGTSVLCWTVLDAIYCIAIYKVKSVVESGVEIIENLQKKINKQIVINFDCS
jgi:hypothetical protein